MWYRRCQECRHVQVTKPPREYKTEAWRDLKCVRCHSIALDYGSESDPRRPEADPDNALDDGWWPK